MDEAVLHDLSHKMGGRFKLTALVQKRLLELMREDSPVIKEKSGGRPVSLVIQEVARGRLQLVSTDGTPIGPGPEQLAAMAAAAAEEAPVEESPTEAETEPEEDEAEEQTAEDEGE